MDKSSYDNRRKEATAKTNKDSSLVGDYTKLSLQVGAKEYKICQA